MPMNIFKKTLAMFRLDCGRIIKVYNLGNAVAVEMPEKMSVEHDKKNQRMVFKINPFVSPGEKINE